MRTCNLLKIKHYRFSGQLFKEFSSWIEFFTPTGSCEYGNCDLVCYGHCSHEGDIISQHQKRETAQGKFAYDQSGRHPFNASEAAAKIFQIELTTGGKGNECQRQLIDKTQILCRFY